MRLPHLLLAASATSALALADHPLMRRADDNAPETAANKTLIEPKRFIVEFTDVTLP